MVTISTHNGSAVHQAHNMRAEKVVSKEKHIDPNGVHETWLHEPVREAYHRLFDEAVAKYNAGQTRAERKIDDYYNKVQNDAKQNPAYEMIIGIYGAECSEETGKAIMREFVEGWQERNPNLALIGAYYHADEQGEPHVHLDYIPVAHGYTKGMETQAGLVKAYGEMGFEKQGKITAQIQWEARENKVFDGLCRRYGLEVSHPREEGRRHVETEDYKAQKRLESTLDHTKELLDIHDDLRAERSKLEAIRDKAEKQAEKALKRKVRAFSRSWKKDKECGWDYDKGLEREIREIVEERAEDVKSISHTNLDVEAEYDRAKAYRDDMQRQIDQLKKQAEVELAKAHEYRKSQEAYIKRTAEIQAREMFDNFVRKEFHEETKGREARLEKYCRELKFENGESVLDKFNAEELKRRHKLEHSWNMGWSR